MEYQPMSQIFVDPNFEYAQSAFVPSKSGFNLK